MNRNFIRVLLIFSLLLSGCSLKKSSGLVSDIERLREENTRLRQKVAETSLLENSLEDLEKQIQKAQTDFRKLKLAYPQYAEELEKWNLRQ